VPQAKQCRLAGREFGLHSNNILSAAEFVFLISLSSQQQNLHTAVMKCIAVFYNTVVQENNPQFQSLFPLDIKREFS
jgi:hypothetical protein